MYAIGIFAKGKVEDESDYLVAGRRLPFSLSTLTLLATWFGAETLLTTPGEVVADGLRVTALDPIGVGLCLVIAGIVVAGPMWRLKLLTLGDFFRLKFGRAAELLASLILVPSYFGWVAAQFLALAEVMHLFFNWDASWGLVVIAIVGTGYTLLGGMWSVTLTDAVQMAFIFFGLLVLTDVVYAELGNGSVLAGIAELKRHDADKLVLVPTESRDAFLSWLNVLAVGALGNIPGQDLMQRMFASKSARVAQTSCIAAGVLYWAVGLLPVMLAVAAGLLMPELESDATLAALAGAFLNPFLASVFVVVILSAVLSTVTSAVLSPAGILAQNVLAKPLERVISPLMLNRLCAVFVAFASLVTAWLGESAAELLGSAYEMTLVGLLAPLLFGIWTKPTSHWPALASMLTGIGLWFLHFALGLHDPNAGWDEWFLVGVPGIGALRLPAALSMTACSFAAYVGAEIVERWRQPPPKGV
jgi:Na+/proline symporter